MQGKAKLFSILSALVFLNFLILEFVVNLLDFFNMYNSTFLVVSLLAIFFAIPFLISLFSGKNNTFLIVSSAINATFYLVKMIVYSSVSVDLVLYFLAYASVVAFSILLQKDIKFVKFIFYIPAVMVFIILLTNIEYISYGHHYHHYLYYYLGYIATFLHFSSLLLLGFWFFALCGKGEEKSAAVFSTQAPPVFNPAPAYNTQYQNPQPPVPQSAPASPAVTFCPACGAKVEAGAAFCTNCGNKVSK